MNNIITIENFEDYHIGAKAKRLFEMKKNGIAVPDFICIKRGCSRSLLESILRERFSSCKSFSVRSSASAEDGNNRSFAGQFSTFLNVKPCNVYNYAESCFKSVNGDNVRSYCDNAGIDFSKIDVTVIIQEMIPAELSGVIFTMNPQGILNETVIAVGRGTGNNVVEDKTPVTQYFYNNSDRIYYYETQKASPVPEPEIIDQLVEISEKIKTLFGGYPDIEFAIKNGEIYILQARPITSLDLNALPVILDSSNISESYPGVSSPMTISFVREVYYLVFKSCIRRLTKNDRTAEKLDDTLHNMTDSANGRIYYRISSWYDVILLLPFSKRIIPIWQEMLGVKDKRVSSSGKGVGAATKLRVLVSFFQLILTNEKKMEWLNNYFAETFGSFEEKVRNTSEPEGLLEIYTEVRDSLADVWDLTLVNDMYSFIFTGLLKSSLKHSCPNGYQELTNMYISDMSEIESMKPLKMLEEITGHLEAENRYQELEKITDADSFGEFISRGGRAAEMMKEYISLYGDRSPCELKLEAPTCRTNPEQLAAILRDFVKPVGSITEARVLPKLRGLKKKFAEKAAVGIMLRERSRLARGRIFGLVRGIIMKIAQFLTDNGRIDCVTDIFYLTFGELEKAVKDKQMPLKGIIEGRREQFGMYEKLPPYSRIVFSEKVFDKNPVNINSEKVTVKNGMIRGIPCSSGIVEGEVLCVDSITENISAEGKILVARMTDPGWVFLIMQCKGIISEKGSLLSHTAIISRELHKPAVVGADKIFSILNDGDYVRINGGTGEIEILRRT